MTSVRLLSVRALMTAIAAEVAVTATDPTVVQVIDHDPGKNLQRVGVYVVDVVGTVTATSLAGGTDTATADDFTISTVCRASVPGDDSASAADLVDELYRSVRQAVLGVSHGGDLDGTAGVATAELGTVDGPVTVPDDNGYLGLCRVEVRITTDEDTP